MIISMQGNWTIGVKAKNAAFDQRFIVSGAASGNGTHAGTPGTTVAVTGWQWSIAIQNNPGKGFQLSDTVLKFPHKVGGNYVFEIWSNDAGGDQDVGGVRAIRGQRLGDQPFVVADAVGVRCIRIGGVDEGDALLERGVDRGDRLGLVAHALD